MERILESRARTLDLGEDGEEGVRVMVIVPRRPDHNNLIVSPCDAGPVPWHRLDIPAKRPERLIGELVIDDVPARVEHR